MDNHPAGHPILADAGSAAGDDLAIVGMACVFPGAPDLAAYWQNILARRDCITDAPPGLWDLGVLYDPEAGARDRVYCRKGGFLQAREREFDPLKYGIMPSAVEGCEPDQFLALKVAHEAMADAGCLERPRYRKSTAVILGRGAYVNAGLMNLVQHGWVVEQTLQILQKLHPGYTAKELGAIKAELKKGLPPLTGEIVPGQVPNIAAGRIANRLDLMGPSYTVDAACASSLIALDMGCRLLRNRECDLALVGGMQAGNTVLSYLMFCLINSLSRRSRIRPFDKDADGTILGEGVGMAVLKRRRDAEADGDRIYALIKGVGTASDGKALGILAPRLEGVELALRRAYDSAGVTPDTVSLMEAHGTATAAGDQTEISALTRVFGEKTGPFPRCALGSVKSMIGHLLGASGMAGLIKAALALYHKTLPPTLNCSEPNPKLALHQTLFYVNTEARPWIHGSDAAPRRAGVNAMGFGGINAHAVLEEYTAGREEADRLDLRWDSEVFVFSGRSRDELTAQVEGVERFLAGGPDAEPKDLAFTLNRLMGGRTWRLAVVADSLEDLRTKLGKARERLADPGCRRIRSRDGIFFFAKPLGPGGKLAVLFPGEGAQYVNMLADLCLHFPEVRQRFDRMDQVFSTHAREFRPSDVIFPSPPFTDAERRAAEERLFKMDVAVEALLTANDALFDLLTLLGIRPDALLGHSTGEYSSLRAAGVMSITDGPDSGRFLLQMNQWHHELAAAQGIPRAALVAVAADSAVVAPLLEGVGEPLYIAMDNCPHQTVVAGDETAVARLKPELKAKGLLVQVLPFDRPYHTPLFAPYTDMMDRLYRLCGFEPPRVPVYSCTTCDRFPDDPAAIRRTAVDHWTEPVRFKETVEKMYADGVRLFVEAGPRGNLTAFVNDILGRREHLAVAADLPTRPGIRQLNHLLAQLAAHGVEMDLAYLYRRRRPEALELDAAAPAPERQGRRAAPMTLSLQFPRLELKDGARFPTVRAADAGDAGQRPSGSPGRADGGSVPALSAPGFFPAEGAPASRVMQEHFQTMERFLEMEQALMVRFLSGQGRLDTDPSAAAPPLKAKAVILEEKAPAPPEETPAAPPDAAPAPDAIGARLLALVAEKTGYPEEMLDLSMNLEADLGIDSIKRQEILSELGQEMPGLDSEDLEKVASLKTLQEMLAELGRLAGNAGDAAAPLPDAAGLPFIGEVRSFVPEREVVVRRRLSLDEDRFLADHTIGRRASAAANGTSPLPVMPLTMSMEILAEAGALIAPGKVLTGMRQVRAHHWIALETPFLDLHIRARREPGADTVAVEIAAQPEGEEAPEAPLLIGTLVYADAFPAPPALPPFQLGGECPSRWQPEELYVRGMFHGPSWQGVAGMDRLGADGAVATLAVLPAEGFFRSEASPRLVTDPMVLDAAGQVIGLWALERLERDFLVFPYRAEALEIYGPRPPVGGKVECRARIRLEGARRVSSDIDMVREDGTLWMRLLGWEDKRFDLPPGVQRFLLAPLAVVPSADWPEALFPAWAADFHCRRLDYLFRGDGDFWRRVFARLMLSPDETAQFDGLGKSAKRRTEWLAGRLAAKDAVRTFLKTRYDMDIGPADVEIVPDAQGRPVARGFWLQAVGTPPALSLAHSDGTAVALAGHAAGLLGVGIDVERADAGQDLKPEIVLGPAELALFQEMNLAGDPAWLLRIWCAKEALAKALGHGLAGRPQDLVLTGAEAPAGTLTLEIEGAFARRFPRFKGKRFRIPTLHDGRLAAASAILTEGDAHEA